MAAQLKLGIIGMSEGNGHPYSWAAIINGYDRMAMDSCPFPVIPKYLTAQQYPEDFLVDARVTHVWTQDSETSAHIAACSLIDEIVVSPEDMIGHVDAVLLARDDAENHEAMAAPFIDAGLPIYIDKPFALDRITAHRIFTRTNRENQIFTCSALRYAREFDIKATSLQGLGTLKRIEASSPKQWNCYAVHAIEPMLLLAGVESSPRSSRISHDGQRTDLYLTWDNGLEARVSTLGAIDDAIRLRLYGADGSLELVFKDTFFAFRAALATFLRVVRGEERTIPPDFVLRVVEIIELGSRENAQVV